MRVFKKIRDLTRQDIIKLCQTSKCCEECILRRICCITSDPYQLIQDYKRSNHIDYQLERSVYLWENTKKNSSGSHTKKK